MKLPLIILSFLLTSITVAQKTTTSEIDNQVNFIDSLNTANELRKFEYQDMSWCGGSLEGFYYDSNLFLIKSIYSAEAGHISEDVYFKDSVAIKIVFNEHAAEWDKHIKNYPKDAYEGNYKSMTYTDTTYQIYLTDKPIMLKYSNSKLINRELNIDLLNRVTHCYKSMMLELKGGLLGAKNELKKRKSSIVDPIIIDD